MTELIKDYERFANEMSEFHVSGPKVSIYFEDNFDDELRKLWKEMDDAILKVIWNINKKRGTLK